MLKYLEHRDIFKSLEFHVYGVGVDEAMNPCIINRPRGRGDWLFMHFHNPVTIMVDGKIAQYQAGAVMIWRPGKAQYYGNPNENWEHSWLHCHGLEAEGLASENNITSGLAGILDDKTMINSIFTLIYDEIIRNTIPDRRILRNLFHNFVINLKRRLNPEHKVALPDRLLTVKKYIEENYAQKINLKKLASLCHLSIPRFCVEFKKHTGFSPIELLLKTRMHHASYQLLNVNLSISEIAERCGYSDPFQFSKIFKKHIGKSPREFRKNSQ